MNEEKKDPVEEFGEKMKAKLVLGKLAFQMVVLPKAKEMFDKAKETTEKVVGRIHDELDPTRGLERNAKKVQDWFTEKGVKVDDAKNVVRQMVDKALKKEGESKEGEKDEK